MGLVASGAVAWLVRLLFSLTGVSPRVDRATSFGCSALVEQCVRKLSRQRSACDHPRSSVLWLAVAAPSDPRAAVPAPRDVVARRGAGVSTGCAGECGVALEQLIESGLGVRCRSGVARRGG